MFTLANIYLSLEALQGVVKKPRQWPSSGNPCPYFNICYLQSTYKRTTHWLDDSWWHYDVFLTLPIVTLLVEFCVEKIKIAWKWCQVWKDLALMGLFLLINCAANNKFGVVGYTIIQFILRQDICQGEARKQQQQQHPLPPSPHSAPVLGEPFLFWST